MANACPVCGGDVEVQLGDVFARCRHCRASVIVQDGALLTRYVVRRTLTAETAASALSRWMQGNEPVAGLALLCSVDAPTLEWLPVWYARAKAPTGFTAYEARADETCVPEVKRRLIPPAALERLRADTSGDDDAGDVRAELPAPTVPVEHFRSKVLAGLDIKELALVHVPHYRFVYTYRGHRYSAAVDAATGEVRPGLFPKKPELPFVLLTVLTLAVYLVAHAIVGFTYQDGGTIPHWLVLAYPATLAGSAALALLLLALL